MSDIAELTRLKSLDIRGCNVTDSGLAHLKSLPQLAELVAHPTEHGGGLITDAGAAHLKEISTLKRIDLSGNRISNAAIDELKAVLPECEVTF